MSVSINIDQVVKKFGNDTIINGLSLDIHPGEFFTLLGPSGCGKTTLLRMIIGFNSIEGGDINIDGVLINHTPVNKRNMGMVFQNYAIFPHMSVKDNVAFGLKNRNLPKDEIEKQVDEILKIVKIEHLKDRMPEKLSGGQQQRVALARAIVIHPDVLLMDEPLSNLDAKLRVEMRNAIKDIQKKVGITTVYVTHDQEEALAVSDRIAVMNAGVIQQIDTPKNIYQRPTNVFVATFIGLSNILEAKLEGDTLVFGDYRVQMPNMQGTGQAQSQSTDRAQSQGGVAVKVSVRPEEFIINTNSQTGIRATVKSSVFLGVNTHYFIETQDGAQLEVIKNSELEDTIPDETEVFLEVMPHKINVFDETGSTNLIKRKAD